MCLKEYVPYPSGAGLAMLAPLGLYWLVIIYARYKRHKGFNVLPTNGVYDSFGLLRRTICNTTGFGTRQLRPGLLILIGLF